MEQSEERREVKGDIRVEGGREARGFCERRETRQQFADGKERG